MDERDAADEKRGCNDDISSLCSSGPPAISECAAGTPRDELDADADPNEEAAGIPNHFLR